MEATSILPSLLINLIPLFTLTCISVIPYVILCVIIAEKKGFNTALACLIALVPLVNLPFGIWLASRIDTAVLERLKALETKNVNV